MGKVEEIVENIVWKCPECRRETAWTYYRLAQSGNPVCLFCDCDMEWEGEKHD
jgi:hypothetical protein